MSLTLILSIVIGHFVADWVMQSDRQAIGKSKDWWILTEHIAVYTGVLAICVSYLLPPSPYPYVSLWMFGKFITLNSVAHFVQDAITSRITSRLWFLEIRPIVRGDGSPYYTVDGQASTVRDTGTRHWFFVMIGCDQLIHYVTLFVTAWWWLG